MDFAEGDKRVLRSLAKGGYQPGVIYDVGGSDGAWTRSVREVFGSATYEIFEPLAAHNPAYSAGLEIIRATPGCRIHPIALGDRPGHGDLRVFDDTGVGSSLIGSSEYDQKKPIRVPVRTLDEMVRAGEIKKAQLIKMDIQGGELAVLNGAREEVLPHAELLVLESWFIRGYGPQTPLAWELVNFLSKFGFFPFEIGDEYRSPEGLLIVKDIWFARPGSAAGQVVWASVHASQLPSAFAS